MSGKNGSGPGRPGRAGRGIPPGGPPGHFLEGEGLLLFGHRGYSKLAPENTLAAFRLLLERGHPGGGVRRPPLRQR